MKDQWFNDRICYKLRKNRSKKTIHKKDAEEKGDPFLH
jgi:hypothetical protein